jgi:hypothetical protein
VRSVGSLGVRGSRSAGLGRWPGHRHRRGQEIDKAGRAVLIPENVVRSEIAVAEDAGADIFDVEQLRYTVGCRPLGISVQKWCKVLLDEIRPL